MNRLTVTFLAFLTLATLSAGVTYQNAQSLLNVHGSVVNVLVLVISTVLLGFAMLVLGRIIYLTAPRQAREETVK